VLLLGAKGVAAIWSSSLSLIASLVDSALDLLCTIIIWTTNKLVGWRLTHLKKKFPVGRRRLEPLGILVFSIIMVISFLQILQESVKKLLPSGDHDVATLPPAAIFAMVATIVVKGTIWFGCARVKTTQVQALAQDCKTDVYFNTLSLLFPLIGHQVNVWWLDPVGATILSLYIIYDWAGTCLENVTRLTGEAANDRTNRKLMFMAYRFEPLVEGFKSIKAYHAGDGVCVEIDVLMPEDAPLRRCHDVAETLQYCLEGLSEVDRAFVTVDCKYIIFHFAPDIANILQICHKGPLAMFQTTVSRRSTRYCIWFWCCIAELLHHGVHNCKLLTHVFFIQFYFAIFTSEEHTLPEQA
jgi:cation diffusion facilitator family transporter